MSWKRYPVLTYFFTTLWLSNSVWRTEKKKKKTIHTLFLIFTGLHPILHSVVRAIQLHLFFWRLIKVLFTSTLWSQATYEFILKKKIHIQEEQCLFLMLCWVSRTILFLPLLQDFTRHHKLRLLQWNCPVKVTTQIFLFYPLKPLHFFLYILYITGVVWQTGQRKQRNA